MNSFSGSYRHMSDMRRITAEPDTAGTELYTEEELAGIELETREVELSDERRELVRTVMAASLHHEGKSGDVTILITTPEEIRRLNSVYRHVDSVTDVLTFPAWEGDQTMPSPDGYLGDVAICLARALEQAEEYGHSPERALGFLTAHGALHLLGYDHMTKEDEERMLSTQEEILRSMGLTRTDAPERDDVKRGRTHE